MIQAIFPQTEDFTIGYGHNPASFAILATVAGSRNEQPHASLSEVSCLPSSVPVLITVGAPVFGHRTCLPFARSEMLNGVIGGPTVV
jgi:hypothetical protein